MGAGGILLLGVLLVPWNPGAASFFIYAASFIAYSGRRASPGALLGVLLAVLALETPLAHLSPYAWVPAAGFSLMIGGICIHGAEVKRANAKLRMAQEEIERLAQTAERERIARDLHDVLGHTLSLITLKSELAGKLVARDPERAGREIREVERISREALREVRTAIAGYRSEGLQAEMGRARLALESAGVRLEYFAQPVELDPVQETVLALALRESVTNVVRHAGARTCRITLEQTGEETRLEVHDDGRGGAAPEGIGLASMRERVEGLGGRAGARTRRPGPRCGSPCRAGRSPSPVEDSRPRTGGAGRSGAGYPIRVLIAEDQGMVLGSARGAARAGAGHRGGRPRPRRRRRRSSSPRRRGRTWC